MRDIETFVRKNNIELFLSLSSFSKLSDAVKGVGITNMHASRLLQEWKKQDWIVKTSKGKYEYTQRGRAMREMLEVLKNECMEWSMW